MRGRRLLGYRDGIREIIVSCDTTAKVFVRGVGRGCASIAWGAEPGVASGGTPNPSRALLAEGHMHIQSIKYSCIGYSLGLGLFPPPLLSSRQRFCDWLLVSTTLKGREGEGAGKSCSPQPSLTERRRINIKALDGHDCESGWQRAHDRDQGAEQCQAERCPRWQGGQRGTAALSASQKHLVTA